MTPPPRFSWIEMLGLFVVIGLAATLRAGYLHLAADDGRADPALVVQGDGELPPLPSDAELRGRRPPTEFDNLVHNLTSDARWFGSLAPLAIREETTAHVAPGYYWLVARVAELTATPDAAVRWLQCGLGVTTVVCLYLFARRAFASARVAWLAGVLAAIHPFWIINGAELADGTVATFLLAAALALGARGSQTGDPFASLLFGLTLAAAATVRAALLVFALIALLWFLYQCKRIRYGWFNAILVVLGFANGVAPWALRNWRVFEEPVPIVTSTYLHLWIGNHPGADGGPKDEAGLRQALAPERLTQLLDEPNQARRYAGLANDVLAEVQQDPAATVTRRCLAGAKFLVGDQWFRRQQMSEDRSGANRLVTTAPDWLTANVETALHGAMLLLLSLGLLGWRWTYAWRKQAWPATLAFLWIPVPYLLGHAETLSGPRLPWDAPLICFSAYALACVFPSVAHNAELD
ncbi:MAG: glycosyltransferase family 39 protein [Gemmataceae bacterium]|nr:glycosyltransferase family 39 protein [Gemmataceae bacterium]